MKEIWGGGERVLQSLRNVQKSPIKKNIWNIFINFFIFLFPQVNERHKPHFLQVLKTILFKA